MINNYSRIKRFLSLILTIHTIASFAKTYYVSTSGNNSNTGLAPTPAMAWKTLTYAAGSSSPVVAGDIVYVQAGNFNENVIFSKSGTAGNPITFQGYKNTPGDLPPLLVGNANPYSSFNINDMPTFDGGNRATGTGFNCSNQKYLIIKNFQIQNYAYGFIAGGANQTSGNIILNNVN
ncbi:MAG: hypothetical protein H0W84_02245, partial [Bacteroidetes bacterium]|nr:hypothetical protein [Bacteroidota bacterium]